MVIADTSVWIDHLHARDRVMEELLTAESVLSHPFAIGELACGRLTDRTLILHELDQLPRAAIASNSEVLALIEAERLHCKGIGLIDVHLLASARLSAATLLTRDRRLRSAAETLSVAWRQ